MGFLTPILVRNDAIDFLLQNPLKTLRQIETACLHREARSLPVGTSCNPMESLGTRHADTARVIVIMGNTWLDISDIAYGNREKDSITNHEEGCFNIAADVIKRLRKKIKEWKEDGKTPL